MKILHKRTVRLRDVRRLALTTFGLLLPLSNFPSSVIAGESLLTKSYNNTSYTSSYTSSNNSSYKVHSKLPPLTLEQRINIKNLTLDHAIGFAVQRNADVLQQLEEIERLKGVYITVRSDALPTLTAAGNYKIEDRGLVTDGIGSTTGLTDVISAIAQAENIPVTADLLGSSFTVANQSYQVSLQVTQNVFTGGRVYHAIRSAQLTEGIAYYQFREVVNSTILNVRSTFYQVLYYDALIGVQRETIRQLAAQLEDQRNRFAAGTVPRFNVLQAEVALANQEPQLIAAENNYQISKLQLARIIGVDSIPTNDIIADFHCVGELVYDPRDFNIDRCLHAALENRDLLKANRQAVFVQNENISVARAGFLPTIQANSGVTQISRSTDFSSSTNGWYAGVQGTWNIFDGMATYGRIRQARAQQYKAITTLDDTIRQINQDVQTAYQNIIQAKETEVGQALNVDTAREALRLAEARLAAGAGTQLDVLNAQQQLTVAESSKLQAIYGYAVAVANLEYSTGSVTHFQNNFSDPITRSHSQAREAILATPVKNISKGETGAEATYCQTVEQRASGMGKHLKIDTERSGQYPPPIAHSIPAPNTTRVPLTKNHDPKKPKVYSTQKTAPPNS